VKMPDDTRRVVASSPDGEVIAGLDIPVSTAVERKELQWAAGVVYNPFRQAYGAFVDRDISFLRLGAQLNQRDTGGAPKEIWLKAGIKF